MYLEESKGNEQVGIVNNLRNGIIESIVDIEELQFTSISSQHGAQLNMINNLDQYSESSSLA